MIVRRGPFLNANQSTHAVFRRKFLDLQSKIASLCQRIRFELYMMNEARAGPSQKLSILGSIPCALLILIPTFPRSQLQTSQLPFPRYNPAMQGPKDDSH